MSAFGFDDDQIEELTKALEEAIQSLPVMPPAIKGKDVVASYLIPELTLEQVRRVSVN